MNESSPWYAPWQGTDVLPAEGWALVAASAGSAAVVLLLVPLLRRLAWWTGFLDHPEARKQHIHATPLLGGLAVALGTFAGAGLAIFGTGLEVNRIMTWWAIGGVAALGVGLYDDRFGMSPVVKLGFQIAIGVLFLAGGVYPHGGAGLWFGLPLGLFWLLCMMNAINFLDNMDGIVGGLGTILAAGLGVLLMAWGRTAEAIFAFALAAACAGFLRFNFPPASLFLGDAGSLFVGYSLGALSLVAAHAGPGLQGTAAGLLILGYPMFDLSFVVVTRIREGRKIYQGGKDHTTHRLNRLVRGPRWTAIWLYVFAISLTLTGVGLALADGFGEVLPWLAVWTLWLAALGIRLARVPAS